MNQDASDNEFDDDFDSFYKNIYPRLDEVEKDHQFLIDHSLKRDRDMRIDRKGRLVIPLIGLSLKIIAFLFISKKGGFRILGGNKKHFALINRKSRKPARPILITKDYASAKSLAEATNFRTIATLDSEPISNFAESIQMIFPDSPIVIAASTSDRDQEPDPSSITNLRSFGYIYPRFAADLSQPSQRKGSFNDLNQEQGIMEVRRQVRMKLSRLADLQESKNIRSR